MTIRRRFGHFSSPTNAEKNYTTAAQVAGALPAIESLAGGATGAILGSTRIRNCYWCSAWITDRQRSRSRFKLINWWSLPTKSRSASLS